MLSIKCFFLFDRPVANLLSFFISEKPLSLPLFQGAMASIDNIRTVAALTREETFAQVFSERMWEPHRVNVRKSVSACAAFGVTQGMYYVTFAVCFFYGAELLKDDDIEYYDIFK